VLFVVCPKGWETLFSLVHMYKYLFYILLCSALFSSSWLLFFLNNKNTAHRYVYIDTGILEVMMMRTEKNLRCVYISHNTLIRMYTEKKWYQTAQKEEKTAAAAPKQHKQKCRELWNHKISPHTETKKRILHWELTQPSSINRKEILKITQKKYIKLREKSGGGIVCLSNNNNNTLQSDDKWYSK